MTVTHATRNSGGEPPWLFYSSSSSSPSTSSLWPAEARAAGEHGLRGLLTYRVVAQVELIERRQRPTAQGGGERGAAGVGDLVVVEVQPLERLERACGGLGDHGGHALVADVGPSDAEPLERRQPAQSRQQGGQPRVAERVGAEVEAVERGQRPLGEGRGESSGALGSDLCVAETEAPERGQAAAAEAICQRDHALVAVVVAAED
mmetsp:Transcript_17182/g.38832  ORF Transcript_17182/g.38832 Transcript_17182/m.38832 type:complete len:205 (+) Transcript_17182:34-648(+)